MGSRNPGCCCCCFFFPIAYNALPCLIILVLNLSQIWPVGEPFICFLRTRPTNSFWNTTFWPNKMLGLVLCRRAPALELVMAPKRWFLLLGTGFRAHGLSARYVYCSRSVFAYCYGVSLLPGHVRGEMEEMEECEHTGTHMHTNTWTCTGTAHTPVLEIWSSCHTSVSSASGTGFFLHSPIPYSRALLPQWECWLPTSAQWLLCSGLKYISSRTRIPCPFHYLQKTPKFSKKSSGFVSSSLPSPSPPHPS